MNQDPHVDQRAAPASPSPSQPAPEQPEGKVLEIELRAIKERRDVAAARLADIFPCK